jgi:RNA polymerase sigma-70 factor (ECF subfamily)
MILNTEQFLGLLKPNYNDAVNYCNALCSRRNPDDGKDLLQQSLLQSMEKFDTLKDTGKFRSWFFTIITRVFYTSLRTGFWKRFLFIDSVKDIENIQGTHKNGNELKWVINSALTKLSYKERSAILLFELGNFSIEEITQIQNEKSVSTVKSRLSRARKKLRTYILKLENNSNIKLNNQNLIGDIENETIRLSAGLDKGK